MLGPPPAQMPYPQVFPSQSRQWIAARAAAGSPEAFNAQYAPMVPPAPPVAPGPESAAGFYGRPTYQGRGYRTGIAPDASTTPLAAETEATARGGYGTPGSRLAMAGDAAIARRDAERERMARQEREIRAGTYFPRPQGPSAVNVASGNPGAWEAYKARMKEYRAAALAGDPNAAAKYPGAWAKGAYAGRRPPGHETTKADQSLPAQWARQIGALRRAAARAAKQAPVTARARDRAALRGERLNARRLGGYYSDRYL